ncbi:zinc ABC transporter substrate-binding protein ZnuA [Neptuniibacter sp. 1_MG-2023]|uniref:zinc ABC transporter substrate-binding protein ZnuA n=1 Tax=Neptuniibacter sp. 1_MG-2023 TaxID=3062662 RepID=UPI0026E1FD0B|nr:zinc ABC transporter substrate-binding protein ZnuA [Neptuniibacter sp. 1_MG-2023]MDO6594070.1 zinc ABC transporter substrate-binding protein ZnuA [Neptuniibacter sp. 1_MG-2023]
MKKLAFVTAIFLLSPMLIAQERLQLVTSVKPLQLVAHAIVADLGEVDLLIPPGASPHHYSLKPSDIRTLQKADLVIWVGPEMEQFLEKALQRSERPVLQLLKTEEEDGDHHEHEHQAASHKEEEHEEHNEHDEHEEHGEHHHHGDVDPHIWMDPIYMLEAAEQIKDMLQQQSPELSDKLEQNYQAFKRDLLQADKQIQQQLAPHQKSGFVVFHDAFSLFVEHYGLNQRAFFTVDPARSPGAKKLARIEKILNEPAVRCVFVEPQFEAPIVERIVADLPVNLGRLDPLATDVSLSQGYVGYLKDLANSIESCLK